MLCAAVVTGANASAALAGEITGNGKPTGAPQHANSICVFSGENNDPTGSNPELNGPGGVSQSYGQELKRGLVDPQVLNPGGPCNGHTGGLRRWWRGIGPP
jgi:hypothetical protein